jgi:hypothetical protein
MGVSKKKTRKQTKITSEEVQDIVEKVHAKRQKKEPLVITDDQLFSMNVGKGNLKEKREKLKADRFKAPTHFNRSSVDEKIVKYNLDKMVRKASNSVKQIDKPAKLGLFGGELEDIWGNDGKAMQEVDRSNHMKRFKAGFSKKDRVDVKQVINPIGGLSYNPSTKHHKSLLRQVAETEEKLVA